MDSHALMEEIRPIVGLNGVEAGHDIVERIGFERGNASRAAFEGAAEIVERFRALAELADQ